MTAPTNKGILTDKEGTGSPGLRIDDQPWKVAPYVQKYLDAIPKKTKVCFQTTDGKISKIWEDKEQGNTENCTSPASPAQPLQPNAAGLKVVEGQIVALDMPAHKITVKDRAGVSHTMIWGPTFNDAMSRLKQWYFIKLTGEYEKDVDLWRLTAQEFFRKPDDWPASQHGGGGRQFQPRNEKPMLYESVFKSLAEMFDPEKDGKGKSFEENADRVWAKCEEISGKMLTKSGVA